jgi:hypothetical protein
MQCLCNDVELYRRVDELGSDVERSEHGIFRVELRKKMKGLAKKRRHQG